MLALSRPTRKSRPIRKCHPTGIARGIWIASLAGLLGQATPVFAQEVSPSPAPPQAGTTASAAAAAGDGDPAWRATVELYGFLPARSWGTTTIRGFSADVDTTLGELIPLIQTVGSVRGSLENDRFGLMTDLFYSQIGEEKARTGKRGLLTGKLTQSSIQGLYDFAFRYRLGAIETAIGTPGQVTVIPYAGVRLVEDQLTLMAELVGNGPRGFRLAKEGSWKRTWTQPLLGTQAQVFLTPGVRAFARGDIGGFGLAGAQDLSGNAQVGLGVALGNNTQLDLSWRYFGLDYSNGAARGTGLSMRQNGFEVGLKVFF